MLNKKNIRELAYVAEVTEIKPIDGSDNCECASIGGWNVMVKKGEYKVGDKCVYFEIDSLVDTNDERFAFMARYHGKVKTQKFTFGGKGLFYSQGLIMKLSEVGLNESDYKVGDFLTETLNVKYYEQESQARKGNESRTYKSSFNKIKKNKLVKKLMRYKWFRELMFAIFGQKKKKRDFPNFVVISDEERVQNLPLSVFTDKETTYNVTEKVDGSSTTVAIQRLNGTSKMKSFICSRRVCVWDSKTNKIKKGGYYAETIESNPYVDMAEKYHLVEFLEKYMKQHKEVQWAYIQGETYGQKIQKRDYGLKGRDFRAFTFVDSCHGRYTYIETKDILGADGIPVVPILETGWVINDNADEVVALAQGKSEIDGGAREGLVFRSEQNPQFSFKAVDPEFLIKYHG